MVKFGLPKCPCCGRRLNWFRAWAVKTHGEFRCGRCGTCSNVVLNRLLYILAIVAAGVSAVLFLVLVAFVREFDFLALLWIVLPFLLFFLASPFFVQLRPPVPKRQPSELRRHPANPERAPIRKQAPRQNAPVRRTPPPRNGGTRRPL